jgi:hypothetical protein
MGFIIPERVKLAIQKFSENKMSCLKAGKSRRGFCGVASANFFEWLQTESAISSEIEPVELKTAKGANIRVLRIKNGVKQGTNLYIKKVCFCNDTCPEENPATKAASAECERKISEGFPLKTNKASGKQVRNTPDCGHYAIILSDNDSLIVKTEDYILDFTYKQMLVQRNRKNNIFKNGNVNTNLDKLSPYYLATGVETTKKRTARWHKEYQCPSKHIYPINSRGGSRKIRNKNRNTTLKSIRL